MVLDIIAAYGVGLKVLATVIGVTLIGGPATAILGMCIESDDWIDVVTGSLISIGFMATLVCVLVAIWGSIGS
jgi:hypothetical protein